jgi:hypothetical protein
MRQHAPLFEQGHSSFRSKQEITLRGVEMGINWTRQGILKQALYLAEYSGDRKNQSAWLLGLSGCVANDDSTIDWLVMARKAGLSDMDMARVAVHTNSIEGAKAMASMGVDWATHVMMRPMETWANDNQNMSQPNEALIEAMIDPDRARSRFSAILPLHSTLEMALLSRKMKFLEGVLQAGLDPEMMIDTGTLGMLDNRASLLGCAAAHAGFEFITQAFRIKPKMSQETLDQMLLGVAMFLSQEHINKDEGKAMDKLAVKLLKLGANPDREFDFGWDATVQLIDDYPYDRKSKASTREWMTLAGISKGLPPKMEQLLFEQSWPIHKDGAWGVVGCARIKDFGGQGHQFLVKLIEKDPPSDDQLLEMLSQGFQLGTHDQQWELFDALLEAAGARQTQVSCEAVISMTRQMVVDIHKMGEEWLGSVRLGKLVELLPSPHGDRWNAAFDGVKAKLEQSRSEDKRSKMGGALKEAVHMEITTALESFSAGNTIRKAPRRSL